MAKQMPDYSALRQTMVDTQLRTNKVTDANVLAAMGSIPREMFVPDDRASLAYIDEDIQIGKSRCIVEPMILARMIQAAEIGPEDVVLDVACGAGYSSAVLGHIARAVVAVESDTELAGSAGARITKLGLDNVVIEIDGHNVEEILDAFETPHIEQKPKAIVANTLKGRGVGFMEGQKDWHHNRITKKTYELAMQDLKRAYPNGESYIGN